ncbi:MAG TPA: hypothetical protein VJ276_12285 [Thermoanaerobaculia bacterium]|nr:hypothetical protein [Thermoanaerobaculia bacterium]
MAKRKDNDLQRDADLGGYYARDTHRGGLGDDYARGEGGVGSGARGDSHARAPKPAAKRSAAPKRRIGKASE